MANKLAQLSRSREWTISRDPLFSPLNSPVEPHGEKKSFRIEPDPIKVVSVAGETINAHYKAAAWAAEDFAGLAEEKRVHLIPTVIEEDNCFLQTKARGLYSVDGWAC